MEATDPGFFSGNTRALSAGSERRSRLEEILNKIMMFNMIEGITNSYSTQFVVTGYFSLCIEVMQNCTKMFSKCSSFWHNPLTLIVDNYLIINS